MSGYTPVFSTARRKLRTASSVSGGDAHWRGLAVKSCTASQPMA